MIDCETRNCGKYKKLCTHILTCPNDVSVECDFSDECGYSRSILNRLLLCDYPEISCPLCQGYVEIFAKPKEIRETRCRY